jgi:flagellar hook capping protein FlgD
MVTSIRRVAAVAALLFLGLLTVRTASAWSVEQHWAILLEALRRLGWKNNQAMNTLIDANLGTDVPYIAAFGVDFSFVYPKAKEIYPLVKLMADTCPDINTDKTNGFHCDDLIYYSQVLARMQKLEAWMNQRIQAQVDSGWGDAQRLNFLIMLGLLTHAIEDFYCHSNYAGILSRATGTWNPDDYPTWDELMSDLGGWGAAHPGFPKPKAKFLLSVWDSTSFESEEFGGLQTGAFEHRGPQPRPGHPGETMTPWGHRHPELSTDEGKVAWELSIRATVQWIQKALDRLPADCKANMTNYVMTPDSTSHGTVVNDQVKASLWSGLQAIGAVDGSDLSIDLIDTQGDTRCAFSDSSGQLIDFQPGDYPRPDRVVIGAPGAFDSVLTAGDPAARAILERDQGRLLWTRGGVGNAALAQTTFIDGQQGGVNCGMAPCWPGVRGDASSSGVHDNVNSSLGDSVVVCLPTLLRPNGMGMNWRIGYDSRTGNLSVFNGGFRPSLGVPCVVYRMFDPLTKTWSPFDSSELYADNAALVGGDTVVVSETYRMDWPPSDKLGSSLPGGFSINGISLYSQLSFLPRGAKLQYTYKSVELDGSIHYGVGFGYPTRPAVQLDFEQDRDGGQPKYTSPEPRLYTFAVLPGIYAVGSAGSLLAGKSTTPLLLVDPNSLIWDDGASPIIEALRGLGVRADVYRVVDGGLMRGNGLGGHERAGVTPSHVTNFHPNAEEWALADSLSTWYRLIVNDAGGVGGVSVSDADAFAFEQWLGRSTGVNGGDRGLLLAGENAPTALLGAGGIATPSQLALANALGLGSASSPWPSSSANPYPLIDDRFSAPSAVPGLAPPGTFTYPLEGWTGHSSLADAVLPTAAGGVQVCGTYPTGNAAIASSFEADPVADNDQSKSWMCGFSLEATRKSGIPTSSQSFTHSGLENRMRILYKFITSVRGARTPGQTGQCWPCPSAPVMTQNWAGVSQFQTSTYGPLYAVQDFATATGTGGASAPGLVNSLLQNRPNPFNPSTNIPYVTSSPGKVLMRIFDVSGRLVRTLADDATTPGSKEFKWDGETETHGKAVSGVYFYQVTYPDGESDAKRMVVLR